MPAHVLLPRPIGNTGGNMPHGQNAGYLGKSSIRSSSTPTRPTRTSASPTAAARLSDALRVDRRKNWRAEVDKTVSMFETSQDARLLDSRSIRPTR